MLGIRRSIWIGMLILFSFVVWKINYSSFIERDAYKEMRPTKIITHRGKAPTRNEISESNHVSFTTETDKRDISIPTPDELLAEQEKKRSKETAIAVDSVVYETVVADNIPTPDELIAKQDRLSNDEEELLAITPEREVMPEELVTSEQLFFEQGESVNASFYDEPLPDNPEQPDLVTSDVAELPATEPKNEVMSDELRVAEDTVQIEDFSMLNEPLQVEPLGQTIREK